MELYDWLLALHVLSSLIVLVLLIVMIYKPGA